MVKRTLVVFAALALLIVGLVPAASAAEGAADIEGAGNLWAKGVGTAVIDGAGTVRMGIDGDVTIVDHAGDARVWINGGSGADRELESNGAGYELTNFRGRLRVTGSDIEIHADGRMRFHARGTGSVFLQGTGVYRTWSGIGRWTSTGVRLEIGSVNAVA